MNITTTYLGLKLRSPLVPSASAPLTENIDNIKRMEDAGAAAVVLHSIFEEQLRLEEYELHHHLSYGTESFAEALTYFPEPETFHVGAEEYLNMLMVGAKITQICSVLLRHGIEHISVLEKEIIQWMEEHEYESVGQMQGSMSQRNCPDASAFERVQYMKGIQSYHSEALAFAP
jgi:dihydroorotate dehydrogenase